MANLGAAAEARLEVFLDGIGKVLGRKERRASFAAYFIGLLSEAERKSVEPLAARLCGEPGEMDAAHQLALEMIARAKAAGVPPGVFLADSAYGDNVEFRRKVRALGLDYALGVSALTMVEQLDRAGRSRGRKRAGRDLALDLPSKRLTWREGTKGRMSGSPGERDGRILAQ